MIRPFKIKYEGAVSTLLQSAKMMFTSDGAFRTETNWNTLDQNATTNTSLVNFIGVTTNWLVSISGPDWDIGDIQPTAPAFGDFSAVSLQQLVYTYQSGNVKTIAFTGLDSTKRYKLRFAAMDAYDDPAGDTTAVITVAGATKKLMIPIAFQTQEIYFDITGSTTATATITHDTGKQYAGLCAAILEEYSS